MTCSDKKKLKPLLKLNIFILISYVLQLVTEEPHIWQPLLLMARILMQQFSANTTCLSHENTFVPFKTVWSYKYEKESISSHRKIQAQKKSHHLTEDHILGMQKALIHHFCCDMFLAVLCFGITGPQMDLRFLLMWIGSVLFQSFLVYAKRQTKDLEDNV